MDVELSVYYELKAAGETYFISTGIEENPNKREKDLAQSLIKSPVNQGKKTGTSKPEGKNGLPQTSMGSAAHTEWISKGCLIPEERQLQASGKTIARKSGSNAGWTRK